MHPSALFFVMFSTLLYISPAIASSVLLKSNYLSEQQVQKYDEVDKASVRAMWRACTCKLSKGKDNCHGKVTNLVTDYTPCGTNKFEVDLIDCSRSSKVAPFYTFTHATLGRINYMCGTNAVVCTETFLDGLEDCSDDEFEVPLMARMLANSTTVYSYYDNSTYAYDNSTYADAYDNSTYAYDNSTYAYDNSTTIYVDYSLDNSTRLDANDNLTYDYDNSTYADAYDNSTYVDAYDNSTYADAYDNSTLINADDNSTTLYDYENSTSIDAYDNSTMMPEVYTLGNDNSTYADAYDNSTYVDAYDNSTYADAYDNSTLLNADDNSTTLYDYDNSTSSAAYDNSTMMPEFYTLGNNETTMYVEHSPDKPTLMDAVYSVCGSSYTEAADKCDAVVQSKAHELIWCHEEKNAGSLKSNFTGDCVSSCSSVHGLDASDCPADTECFTDVC